MCRFFVRQHRRLEDSISKYKYFTMQEHGDSSFESLIHYLLLENSVTCDGDTFLPIY